MATGLNSLPIISRRRLLSLGAGLSLLPFGQAFANGATTPRVLRLGVSNNYASQTEQTAQLFAREVWKRCEGRVRIDIFFGAALGGEKEMSEDVSAGFLDFAMTSSAGYASKNMAPGLGVFDTPFLFRDLKHARAVLDSPIGEKALAQLDAVNTIGLAWGENGVRQITTRDKPIRSPADLAGVKIRVPQSDVMVAAFKAFGADAKPLPIVDLYSALADGSFDAQENPTGNIKNYNFDKVQKVLSLTRHVYSPTILIASRKTFDQLTQEDQASIRAAAKLAAPLSREINDKEENSDIAELSRRGMTVVTDVDRGAFVKVINANRGQFESIFGKDTLDAIEQFGS